MNIEKMIVLHPHLLMALFYTGVAKGLHKGVKTCEGHREFWTALIEECSEAESTAVTYLEKFMAEIAGVKREDL